jgi:hypothetical protein
MPPENRVIPGLGIEEVAATAASVGLECSSAKGGSLFGPGAYGLGCSGYDADAHAQITISAIYWTLDAVSDLDVIVRPGFGDPEITDPLLPPQVILPFAALRGEATRAWADARMNDSGCAESPCTASLDDADLIMRFGTRGGRHLSISGQVPAS